MSGEKDPLASLDGAIEALRNDDALQLSLVGDENIILNHIPNELLSRIDIVHTVEVVSMDESPVDALRKKKNSSMRLAVNLVGEGKVDGCVSSGNTGAPVLPELTHPSTFPSPTKLTASRIDEFFFFRNASTGDSSIDTTSTV